MPFFLHRDGQSVAFELDELRAMARRGELPQDEYVYDDDKKEWVGASQMAQLAGAWTIEENEATVAMELPPEFFESAEDLGERLAEVASTASAEPAGPSLEPGPASLHQPVEFAEDATRAMDVDFSALPEPSPPAEPPRAEPPLAEEATRFMDVAPEPEHPYRPTPPASVAEEATRFLDVAVEPAPVVRSASAGEASAQPLAQVPAAGPSRLKVIVLSIVTLGIWPLWRMLKNPPAGGHNQGPR